MFSRRTSWPRAETPLAIRARTLRSTSGLIDLTESNVTAVGLGLCAGFPHPLLASAAACYEPQPLGAGATREAIAGYYGRRGIRVDPARVVCTASTSEAYDFAFRLLADPGDEILAPTPSYPLLGFLADLTNVRLVPYPIRFDGIRWCLDLEGIAAALTPRTRAIIVVCPNNPTGSIPSADERAALMDLARRHNLAVISDEVFLDYLRDGIDPRTATSIDEDGPLVLSLSGLSKVAGLPQAKLSWIVLSGATGPIAEARARLELVADTYLSVAGPIQAAAPAVLLEADAWQARLRARLAANKTRLMNAQGQGVRARPIEGGWHAVLDLEPGLDDQDFALALLEKERVLVHPGYLYDISDGPTLVISLLVDEETLEQGLAGLGRCAGSAAAGRERSAMTAHPGPLAPLAVLARTPHEVLAMTSASKVELPERADLNGPSTQGPG